MTPEQFDHYAELGYNRIPLYREVLADLDTPLSVYLKLADRPYSFLLESLLDIFQRALFFHLKSLELFPAVIAYQQSHLWKKKAG